MCGIVGMLQFDSRRAPLGEQDIVRLRDCMAHRGPDGMGVWVAPDGQVGLGHRRLAIIDLTPSGVQPMSDESGRIWLTYNGEIYKGEGKGSLPLARKCRRENAKPGAREERELQDFA